MSFLSCSFRDQLACLSCLLAALDSLSTLILELLEPLAVYVGREPRHGCR